MKDQLKIKKLKNQNHELAMLLQNAYCGICIYDIVDDNALALQYMSDGFCHICNGTEEELKLAFSKDKYFGVQDDYKAPLSKFVKEIIKSKGRGDFTYKAVTLTGEEKWCSYHLAIVENREGHYKGYGTFYDITSYKQIEEQLRQSEHSLEEKYQLEKKRGLLGDDSLLAHASFNLNKNEIIEFSEQSVYKNPPGNKDFDVLIQAVVKGITEKSHKEAFARLHNAKYLIEKYESGETELTIDYRRAMPDGKSIWVHNILHMLKEPNGTDILLFEYCYDVDKQKSIEHMLDFVVNDDYDLVGRINLHDDSTLMLYGEDSYNIHDSNLVEENYTESLIRFTDNVIVPEEREEYFQKAHIDTIREKLKDSKEYEFYFNMFSPTGDVRAKKAKYIRFDDAADLYIFTQTDITRLIEDEQKKREELSDALVEAEKANQSKTKFLSQMSHEIRTPMNAIIGMSQLASESNDLPEIHDYLEKITLSSHYLLGIINDILDMSRIESDQFQLRPEWTSAGELLGTCIAMLEPEIEKKGIKFIYPNLTMVTNMEYYTDALRTKQIFMNLLNNALKFTPPGGTIELKISNLSYDETNGMDLFTVSDTGCGMSEEFQKRVFQPFEQEENPYSDQVQGTGLGLALVKQIITAMGGEISVESKLGKGSTFKFSFPYQYRFNDNKEKNEVKKAPVSLDGKRILLADDHPLNREIARRLLEKQGVTVEEATDGQEALDKYIASEPGYYDAILMDIRMPVLDGLDATRKIRASRKKDARNIAIIAMTANAFEDDVKISIQAGMNAHLAKPIEPELLYKTLSEHIIEGF